MINFRIITLGDNEYAYIDGIKPRPIYKDSRHNKYFCVPNIANLKTWDQIVNPEEDFRGYISQAIQAVIDGNGDEIQEFSDGDVKVLFYLDRDKGETIRKKTLEKYRDLRSKIKYEIVYLKDDTIYRQYNTYTHPSGRDMINLNRIKTYDTREQAVEAAIDIYQNIRNNAKKIIDQKHANEPVATLLANIYNDTLLYGNSYYMGQKIYEKVFWDMFDLDLSGSYMYVKNNSSCFRIFEIIDLA